MDDVIKIITTVVAFFFVFYLAKKLAAIRQFSFLSERKGRHASIDGLRGYLAISVFFHHFIITWYWKNDGLWRRPPEDYFQNYGKVGVAMFFMITGFLFIAKVLNNKEINWSRMFESRVFRIFPLYVFVFLSILLIVFLNTGFQLNVEFLTIIKASFKWFVFYGGEINGFSDTRRIIAGVDWTLKYEWVFYITLPLIARVISYGKLASTLLVGGCLLVFEFPVRYLGVDSVFFILFAVGGVCACLIRENTFNKFDFQNKMISLASVALLVFTLFYSNTFDIWHVFAMSAFFFLVSQGNDLFGLFRQRPSVLLGEVSYSIYLLHGLILYLLFSQFSIVLLDQWSLNTYMLLMPFVSVLVVVVSVIAYLSIEKPGMNVGRHYPFSKRLELLMSGRVGKNKQKLTGKQPAV
ncbi:MAG: acyltransferase family protein [Candidatus Reddybacter sp.]